MNTAALTTLLCKLPSADITCTPAGVRVNGTMYATADEALAALAPAKKRAKAAPKAAEETLAAFAARVVQTARKAPSHLHFGHKVFLCALPVADRARLWEAHRAGLLCLTRCDLVEAFAGTVVADSELRVGVGADVHFLVVGLPTRGATAPTYTYILEEMQAMCQDTVPAPKTDRQEPCQPAWRTDWYTHVAQVANAMPSQFLAPRVPTIDVGEGVPR